MKYLLLITFFAGSAILAGQSRFEEGMEKAFELWETNQWEDAENLFERIAKTETNAWLPNYYIAQMNSIKSWNVKDEALLKSQLSKAQKHLDIAMSKTDVNSELLVMQAQIYTNWVAFDGRTYGIIYASKISEIYEKASRIDSANPRVVFCKAHWGMESAKYFGRDTTPYCKAIEASIKLFNTFKLKTELHPNWGRDRAKKLVTSCKSKS